MEYESSGGAGKTVLLILAVFFSFVFVPFLLMAVPVGGVVISATKMASQASIEQVVKEAGVSEEIFDLLMDEVEKQAPGGKLKPDVIERIAKDSIKKKDVDRIVRIFIDAVYNGRSRNIDLSDVEESLLDNLFEVCQGGYNDLCYSWLYGTPMKYFTESYKNSVFAELEQELLVDYAGYGVSTVAELEQVYDARYGSGAFDDMAEERISYEKSRYMREVENTLNSYVSEAIREVEKTIEDAMDDTSEEDDMKAITEIIRMLDENKTVIRVLVYSVVFGIVLILLLLFRLQTAGFVVSAIPLLFGGIGCKLVGLGEKMFLSLMEEELISEMGDADQYERLAESLFLCILRPFFKGMSDYGNVMLIAGGGLIVAVIVRKIIIKHKCDVEASYS